MNDSKAIINYAELATKLAMQKKAISISLDQGVLASAVILSVAKYSLSGVMYDTLGVDITSNLLNHTISLFDYLRVNRTSWLSNTGKISVTYALSNAIDLGDDNANFDFTYLHATYDIDKDGMYLHSVVSKSYAALEVDISTTVFPAD